MKAIVNPLEPRLLLSIAAGDFDGDGFEDMAVGSPAIGLQNEPDPNSPVVPQAFDGIPYAGAVNVVYGTFAGLDDAGNQQWHLRTPGVKGNPSEYDHFGNHLAVGDFDNDGFDDLAISIEAMIVSQVDYAGAVLILYGSKDGLDATRDSLLTQDSKDVNGSAETGDLFGASLAAGDFDGDGFDDVAVGAPGEDAGEVINTGRVHTFYGTANGIRFARNQFWQRDTKGIPGKVDPFDYFGAQLAAGDFNNDGRDDLAIGNPLEYRGAVVQAGNVQVLFGRKSGLSAKGDQFFDQESTDVADDSEQADKFGHRLAVADFQRDGFDDLIVVSRNEAGGAVNDAYNGTAHLFYGSANKLVGTNLMFTRNDFAGLSADDHLGEDLTTGDFNGDGYGDLAIGAYTALVATGNRAGLLVAFHGSNDGLDASTYKVWSQDIDDLNVTAEEDDFFAKSLGTGDFDGDGRDELAIAAPGENEDAVNGASNAGGVHVLHGFLRGLIPVAHHFWTGSELESQKESHAEDFFGDTVDFLIILD